jgi:hypothetical protein
MKCDIGHELDQAGNMSIEGQASDARVASLVTLAELGGRR